ncbi:MAG: Verru_Chthon cassette protein A, partial [Verrucomicrobiota bacterium]
MKHSQKPLRKGKSKQAKQGVALVTVLTVMALTTILVLTFFSLATSEHRSSKTYSQGLQAQQVAEQAVNMVIAQIREATTIGTTNAWASQPGAIRNWEDTGLEGPAYKLYSDDQMKISGGDWADFQADFDEMASWDTMPNHYVDLNEPVIRGEKVYYPIVSPQASNLPEWPNAIGGDEDGVEGFSYNTLPNRILPEGVFGIEAAQVGSARDGHLPMPAMWIYQLADGTLGILDKASASSPNAPANFTPISGQGAPSEKNRIVARFAFWTDDETSKLNVNTHAGGLAWDVPKTGGEMDMAMGRYQPAQKEWQRYPGHPATTHLIPALAPGVLDIVNDREAMEMIFNIVPRVVPGGSESGTRLLNTRDPAEANGLIPDDEPLFPSVDDMVMRSDRTEHEFPDAEGNPVSGEDLSEYLERAKFFLTVSSRAPETNLFNQPRVAIWPIYNADYGDPLDYNKFLTPFDQLIHYCASMGASVGSGAYPRNEYIFKRENEDSPTFDYLGIQRNQELYQYLTHLLESDIPGYGESFASKYPNVEYRQILTQIFDYIRSTNLHDDSIYGEDFEEAFVTENIEDHSTFTNPRNDNNKTVGMKGHGQVVPIQIPPPSGGSTDTKGFGRFYSLGGVQVQVISVAEPGDIPMPAVAGADSYRGRNDVSSVAVTNESGLQSAVYANFPPHPPGFEHISKMNREQYERREPRWLRELRVRPDGSDRTYNDSDGYLRRLYDEAFEPDNWNWQLGYLDPTYYDNIVNPNFDVNKGPERYKYVRAALTPIDVATGPRQGGPNDPDPYRADSATDPFRNGSTRLKANEQLVQGALLFNLFTPSIGWSSINPDMEIEIEIGNNGEFRFPSADAPTNLGVPFIGFDGGISGQDTNQGRWIFSTNATDTAWGGRRYGGLMPYEFILNGTARVNVGVRELLNGLWANDPGSLGYSDQYHDSYDTNNFPMDYDIQKNNLLYPAASNEGFRFGRQGGRGRYTRLDRGYFLIPDALSELGVEGDPSKVANSYRYDLVTV